MEEKDVSNKAIFDLLQNVLKKSDDIEQQLTTNTNELKQEIKNITAELKTKFELLQTENEQIKQENQLLKTRLMAVERRLKKYNLIFYGIQEQEKGVAEVNGFLDLIIETLGIDIQFSDIRDIHRIGKKVDNKERPLVIEVVNYHLKQEILRNASKLKGTQIYISADYTPEDYQQQKVLRKNLKIARDKNLTAQLKKNTLIVNGEVYTCEDLTEPVTEVQEKNIPEAEPKPTENASASSPKITSKIEETSRKKKKFNELINGDSRVNKRKEQPGIIENQVKRSTRLMKM